MTISKHYAPDHAATEGHFDGHPIIPGVVILSDVLAQILLIYPEFADQPYSLRNAKFIAPVVPGDEMHIALRRDVSTVHFDCSKQATGGTSTVTAKGSFGFAL
jgi:3-hydroxymyristoyl/3-hydroxydecanoyl-(acyl carrier protein) dehydratase